MSRNDAMTTRSGQGKDRLIVALDVPDHQRAVALVQELDNVFFFKIGLELIVSGNVLELIEKLHHERSGEGGIFIDLKVSGDIGNTITRFVQACATHRIKFVTLGGYAEYTINSGVIQTAVEARGNNEFPKLLGVPLLSHLRIDVKNYRNFSSDTDYILNRGEALINEGCDGLIVSGDAIKACREQFTNEIIVSPGIRPSGASTDDHERFTTPGQAIELGADYLVVGRPILNDPNPRQAAERIIKEIAAAMNPATV